jgi:shikimate dehydrogenase
MQNAGIAALGLDWRYLAFDVQPDDLGAAIAGAKAMRFVGLNLTIPHKLLALEMVNELDESAKLWCAVNTIRFEGRGAASDWRPIGQLAVDEICDVRTRGFNTDADAIIRSLEEDLSCACPGAKVLLVGVGGAGRTAARRLAAAGVERLFLVNRTLSKAEEVAGEIRKSFPATHVEVGYPVGGVDLLLNATSLGLKACDPLPFDPGQFTLGKGLAVYDMIYRPAETKLLQVAKAAGCRTANGIGMLLYQGAKALEIWSGQPAPIPQMREALLKNVYGQQSNAS